MEDLAMAVPSVAPAPPPAPQQQLSPLDRLLPALNRLDVMLEYAMRSMDQSGSGEGATGFRGLYISRNEVEKLLQRKPAATPFEVMAPSDGANEAFQGSSPLWWIIQEFQLSPFDADVLLLSLGPEIDLRYEKIYAYLQDDVTRKRPTVELALNLLCTSIEEKVSRRAHFHPDAPLVRNELIHIAPDQSDPNAPFLAHAIRIDDQIARAILGDPTIDPRLISFCEFVNPGLKRAVMPFESELVPVLTRLATQSRSRAFRAYFQGPAETEKQIVAEGLAAALGTGLMKIRLSRIKEKDEFPSLWRLALREARMCGATLYVAGVDEIEGPESVWRRQQLQDGLAGYRGAVILAGRRSWESQQFNGMAVTPIDFETPDYATRVALWKANLEHFATDVDPAVVRTLAGRFKLTAGHIAQAVASATIAAQWREASIRTTSSDKSDKEQLASPSLGDLTAAARAQCRHELAGLAKKLEPKYEWEDIVLPLDQTDQLREICAQAENRHIVYGEWGFEQKLSLGKGLNVLFCGPPGTGKTMAAEVIACDLQLDLYRIDLSQVVSKYIGETEKNLHRIFAAAENSNGILFFDEADALFGKRSEIRDSHDRYANIEISYLLQKMEEYAGVSILATNLRQNLDDAFVRRLQFIIEFPFPDEEYRRRIWERAFPKETPLGEDVKFEVLARDVRLAGGSIKNMALAAAFYAAAAGDQVRMKHLIQAAQREHQKLGRSWNSSEPQLAKTAVK
jgi:ATPase family associated with various cellular activities (AAA)